MRKIAEWLCQNEEEYLTYKEKDKVEEAGTKLDLEDGMNIFNKCLEFYEKTTSSKPRFSFDIQKNICLLTEK